MIKFIKRYVCQGKVQNDYENKVDFFQVIVEKEDGSLEWNDVVVKGFLVYLKGGNYDRFIRGMYKIKEEKWKELESKLFDKVEVIDCNKETELEVFELALSGVSLPEIQKFLEENAEKVK